MGISVFQFGDRQQVYTALVSICGRASQWLQALDLFDQARKTHVACDTSMYNALISACGVGLAWEKSLELLGSLQGTVFFWLI